MPDRVRLSNLAIDGREPSQRVDNGASTEVANTCCFGRQNNQRNARARNMDMTTRDKAAFGLTTRAARCRYDIRPLAIIDRFQHAYWACTESLPNRETRSRHLHPTGLVPFSVGFGDMLATATTRGRFERRITLVAMRAERHGVPILPTFNCYYERPQHFRKATDRRPEESWVTTRLQLRSSKCRRGVQKAKPRRASREQMLSAPGNSMSRSTCGRSSFRYSSAVEHWE